MSITAARLALATEIQNVFPELAVFTSPPTQVTTPSATIKLRSAEQHTSGLWSQTFSIDLLGPSGDNEAAVSSIEAMLLPLARHLSVVYAQPVGWGNPVTLSNVGQIYLTCTLEVVVDIAP